MPEGKKGFQKNHLPMGGRPGGSSDVRRKYLKVWEQVFDATDPTAKLTKLAEENYLEFIRLGIAAMPKEGKVDITISRYESWSDADLQAFVTTGEYPDGINS